MTIVLLVIAWALIEAGIAVALTARPPDRTPRPGLVGGLIDWRV